MKGRAQHHLVSAGIHAVATAAATNIVLAMFDFGTNTFADPFGFLFLDVGLVLADGYVEPFECLKGHCFPFVHLPCMKKKHMSGCHQLHGVEVLQSPAMKALHGRLLSLPFGALPFGDTPLDPLGDPARPFPGDFPFAQFPFLPPFDEGDLECNGVVNHLPLGECDGVCEGLLFLPPGDMRVPYGDLGDLAVEG